MSHDRTTRLIRQHAQTSRLLGVDFVPIAPSPPVLPDSELEGKASGPATATPHEPVRISGAAPAPDEAQRLLDQVRARYEAKSPHARFGSPHTNVVFGEGDPCARLMFIGEAPGENEDRTGRPFVGRAGQLLDKMIVAMGLTRETVYICNVLKTRPPNNQTPTIEEAEASAPYLLDQIRVIRPEVIVTLGLPASRLLLASSDPMRALRGSFRPFPPPEGGFGGIFGPVGVTGWEGEPIPVMPTYHPAYLLRSYTPDNRQKVWSDLKQVMDRLGLTPATKA